MSLWWTLSQHLYQEPKSKVIAVEFDAPHDVIVYNMTDEVLDRGRDEYRTMLVRLLECEKNRSWPGRSNGAEIDAFLPAWMMPEDNELDALGLEMSA